MKNKAFILLLSINIILACIDIGLSMSHPYINIIETNSLYFLGHGFGLIILYNIIFLIGAGYVYFKTKYQTLKYILITDLVLLLLLRIMAIKNLINWYNIKFTTENIASIITSNPVAIIETQKTLININWIVLICSITSFMIWKYDNYKKLQNTSNINVKINVLNKK